MHDRFPENCGLSFDRGESTNVRTVETFHRTNYAEFAEAERLTSGMGNWNLSVPREFCSAFCHRYQPSWLMLAAALAPIPFGWRNSDIRPEKQAGSSHSGSPPNFETRRIVFAVTISRVASLVAVGWFLGWWNAAATPLTSCLASHGDRGDRKESAIVIAASVISLLAILLAPILLIRFRKRWVAAFNRAFTNRITSLFAARLPGFGIVTHVGRKSGRVYRTPVNVFREQEGFLIALTFRLASQKTQNDPPFA